MLFEVALVDYAAVPIYISIAEKALQFQQLEMNPKRIATVLEVDRTTVARALRWMISEKD